MLQHRLNAKTEGRGGPLGFPLSQILTWRAGVWTMVGDGESTFEDVAGGCQGIHLEGMKKRISQRKPQAEQSFLIPH